MSGDKKTIANGDDSNLRQPIELLAEEFGNRIRVGEAPAVDDYVADNPELESEIEDLFPMIAILEQMKRDDDKGQARLATTRPLSLSELGDFKVVREIGRGGMGIVYEAVQQSLGRRVALKVLPKAALLDPKQLQRFEREARIAANLHHTNLVSLHGIGEHSGYHFLVMELVDGASMDKVMPLIENALGGVELRSAEVDGVDPDESDLADRDARASLSDCKKIDLSADRIATELAGGSDASSLHVRQQCYFRNVAEIGRDAAQALMYASEQGVLHRDIKPANLILDRDLKVWVSDFGLARALAPSNELLSTSGGVDPNLVTQSVDGTFGYMSPESFDGHLDKRSDIFSLGVTLYEMLTLRHAFGDDNFAATLKRVADGSRIVIPPRRINSQIPSDLETIVLKAVSNNPAKRYDSAGEMADDLGRFLENRPVSASRTSFIEHGVRWCLRNRLPAALMALAGLLVAVTLSVLATSFYRVQRSNNEVTASLQRETHLRERSQSSLALATKALDRIYQAFVPEDLMSSSYVSSSQAASRVATPKVSEETVVVLDNLLRFYDDLSQHASAEGVLKASAIKSLSRVGDIFWHLGKKNQAIDRYNDALDLIRERRNVAEQSSDLTTEAARILNQLGFLHRSRRDYEKATVAHLAVLTELDSFQGIQSDAEHYAADYQRCRANYSLGRKKLPSATQIAISHVARPPEGSLEFLIDQNGANADSPIIQTMGPEDESERELRRRHLRQAIETLLKMRQADEHNPSCRFLLACCYREIGGPEGRRPTLKEAGSEFADANLNAIKILRELVEQFPANPYYRLELVVTLRRNTQMFSKSPKLRKRLFDEMEEAVGHVNWLVTDHPSVPRYAIERMHIFLRQGHAWTGEFQRLRRVGGLESTQLANEAIEKSVESMRLANEEIDRLVQQQPNEPTFVIWAIVVRASLADAFLRTEDLQAAEQVCNQNADLYVRLVKANAGSGRFSAKSLRDLQRVLLGLAESVKSDQAKAKILKARRS